MEKKYFNWKLGIVLLLGLLVLGATAFGLRQWQRGRKAQNGLLLGNIAFGEHKWEEAARQLGRYLTIAPEDVPVLLKYAEAHLKIRPLEKDNLQQAIAAYRNVLCLDPNNTSAAGRLCEIYTGLDMPADAELIAARTLQTIESFELRKALALALAGQRKYDEAAKELKIVIEKYPQQVLGYELLGRLIEQRPKEFSEDPIVWFNRAVESNPGSAEALIARAAFFLRQARHSEAMSDLTQARYLNLSDSTVRLRLAEQLINAGDLNSAKEQLEIAGQTQSDNLVLWKLQSNLAILLNSKETMLSVADNALKAMSSQPWDFMPDAAELFIRSGNFDRAQKCISKMQQKGIAPAQTVFLEGLLAEKEGRFHHSIECWRRAVELGIKSPAARIKLANALWQSGDCQSSINILRALVSEQPALFNARMALAQLLANSGQWIEAAQQIREARQIDPDSSDAALLDAKIRLQLLADSRENIDSSKYTEIKVILDKLEKTVPSIEIELSRFNLAIQQNYLSAARDFIADLKKKYPSEVRVSLAESDLLVATNRTDDAIEVLQKAAAAFPRSPMVLKHLTVLLAAQGRCGDCETLVKNAFESETRLSTKKELGLMLSDIYSRRGCDDKRYSLLNSLAGQLQNDIGVWQELLTCEKVFKDPLLAQQIVDKIRSIEGSDGWQWRYEQARIWLLGKDFKTRYPRIVSLLQENLLANPDDIASRMLLGMACEKAGDQRLAVLTYSEIMRHSPLNVRVMAQAATAFYKAGEYDKVEEVLSQAAREKLYHPALERLEVEGALRRGDFALACGILEKMLDRDPNNFLTGLSLAMLKSHQDNLPAAQDLVQKLRDEDPNSIIAAGAVVDLDIRMGKSQEALRICNEMVDRLNSVSARLLRAKTLAVLGNADKAGEDFEIAVSIEPNNADAWAARSVFYLSLGKTGEAVKDIRQAMSIMPASLVIQKTAISVFLESGNKNLRKEGELVLENAISVNPGDAELMLQKAKLLIAENTAPQIEQATAILQSVTEKQPYHQDAWMLLAKIALQDSKPDRAIDACLRGLVHNPGDRALLLLKAKAEAAISPELAIPTMKALWELDPDNGDTVVSLAETYVAAGKYDAAIKLLDKQQNSGELSQQIKIKVIFAEALYKNDNKTRAEEILRSLRQADPNDLRPLLMQIRLLREDRLWERLRELVDASCGEYSGRIQNVLLITNEIVLAKHSESSRIAEEFLSCVLQQEPNSAAVMIRLGSLLQTSGRSQEAAVLYKRILDLQSDNIIAINNLAWIMCEQKNNYPESLKLTKRGLEIEPDSANLIDTHGMALYRLGRFDLAVKDFEKCLSLYPDWEPGIVASHFHLGRCLAKLGKKNKAMDHLNKAIELNKNVGGMADEDVAEVNRLLKSLSGREK